MNSKLIVKVWLKSALVKIVHLLTVASLVVMLVPWVVPARVAQAAPQSANNTDAFAVASNPVSSAPASGAPSGMAAPLALSSYTYTITLPDDTYVTMGDQTAVLPFTVANGAGSAASIDWVKIGVDPSVYWVSTATTAPEGWEVTRIDQGKTRVEFTAITTTNVITPGSSITFDVVVVGKQYGVFPSSDMDMTDDLQIIDVRGEGEDFTDPDSLPTWERKALAVNLSANPSSLGVGGLVTVTMDVFNRSTITQTSVVPTTTVVITSGGGGVTLATGPTPVSLTIPPGEAASFTWAYTATASGNVAFSNSASNSVASSVSDQSNTVLIGDFTAALSLEPTQIISGQLATVNMTVKNNATSAITDVTPSALNPLGTATMTLASGPTPSSVVSLTSGATASFEWVYTTTGSIGSTYQFTGTASAGSGVTSDVATSPEGVIKKYTVSATPRYVPIGTTNQTIEYVVANNGGSPVEVVEFILLPEDFVYLSAGGGYGSDWDVTHNTGNPETVLFKAPEVPTDALPVGSLATFTITFSSLSPYATDHIFPVRIEDTDGVEETVDVAITMTEYKVVIEASPSSGIYADGVSTSVITATVMISDVAQAGELVNFYTTKGVLSSQTGTTNDSGVVTTTLTAPQSSEDTIALVTASCSEAQDEIVIYYTGSYILTVNTVGNGSVTKNPDQTGYHYGDVVTLTATADEGWTFDEWSGAATGSTSSVTVTMDGNKSVTATFTQDEYTLTINTVGSGSVVSDPVQSTYHYGDVVTLTANANTGWTFDSWTGAATGSTSSVTVTMDDNKSVTATFTRNQYTLTVNTSGNGTVDADPSAPYYYGDVVTLTATADTGWHFDNWSGAASGTTSPVTVTMDSSKTVTATFTRNQYTLTVNTDGDGTVDADPSAPYYYGDVVTLTANANTGYHFDDWTGDASGSTSSVTVTMDGNKSVTATFTRNQHTLTVNTSGNGTVDADPSAPYYYGDVVTLTANADTGWTFDSWTGAATGSTSSVTVTMDDNKSVTATFTRNQYTLTVNTSGDGTVDKDPSAPYHYGDVVNLTAIAGDGWTFTGWSGDLSGSDNPKIITMYGDRSIIALFSQDAPLPAVKLTITPDPGGVTIDQSIAYTAIAEDAEGYSWDVTAETIFSIEVGASGSWVGNVYTSEEAGDWTVTAKYNALIDTTSLTVSPFNIFLPVVLRNH